MRKFRKEVAGALSDAVGRKIAENSLTTPPDPKLGDLASSIAFSMGGNPKENAEKLAKRIKASGLIREVRAVGPYVNFFADRDKMSAAVVKQALKDGSKYGSGLRKKERVMVEFSQPNTHKSIHIGHLRNIALGDSLSRILSFNGYRVTKANYINDFGAHVAKTLWGYIKFHQHERPPENRGRWLGGIYRDACQRLEADTEEDDVRTIQQRMESGDKEITGLWKRTREWSLSDFKRIYNELGVGFDEWFFESDVVGEGKDIVRDMLEKGVAKRDQGMVIIDFDDLGVAVLERSDGTTLYMVADLALAKHKFEDFGVDRSVYVVASEQKQYFQQLFKALELWGFPQAKKCCHLSYELVMLEEGKMRSREGQVVLYDDLAAEARRKALAAVNEKNPDLSDNEKQRVAESVAVGAMKYEMLRVSNNKTITFSWDRALDFNGESAPYIQYAHARAKRILEKSGKKPKVGPVKTADELALTRAIAEFPDVVERAAKNYSPHLVANYAYSLANTFNHFYASTPVIGSEEEVERLALVEATAVVLGNALKLLGVDAPDVM
ncbi:MAG: arginine--tRNA ligase [Candidatus Diapherotrites archaeon]|nr:arginine--tRNA ligase [Candidatus Diapherotrites archaeon]